jgi:hypothetical protein
MHPETLAPETKRVLETLASQGVASGFYLAGGTSLALQLGHRESIDLDFFSSSDFSREQLKKSLSGYGHYEITNEEDGTLDGLLNDVKLTFLRYEYPLLFPLLSFGDISLADKRDIACMKIDAISSRGSKKDFIDLFFLLKEFSLEDIFGFFEQKYIDIHYNKLHLLKSLTYFDDAEDDPSPKMLVPVSWEEVKQVISDKAKKLID